MMKETKPFNLEHAKAGAPYACRIGREATILKWDGRDSDYPLIGVRDSDDTPGAWKANGAWLQSESECDTDLVMTPLGYIDGKPVFVGDEFLNESGALLVAKPHHRTFSKGRWPAPAKQYPVTEMTMDELRSIWAGEPRVDDGLTAIANAALRHAIDNGQVLDSAEFNRLFGERAARDMAIAKAVRETCYEIAQGHQMRTGVLDAMDRMDLGTIIASVKGQ
jgi:hypothetical protein